jgi:hypothetical protein
MAAHYSTSELGAGGGRERSGSAVQLQLDHRLYSAQCIGRVMYIACANHSPIAIPTITSQGDANSVHTGNCTIPVDGNDYHAAMNLARLCWAANPTLRS